MNSQILQKFIKETENRLQLMRGSVLLSVQDGAAGGAMEICRREINTIQEAAAQIGLTGIQNIAARLETETRVITEKAQPFTDADGRKLLDGMAQIEALLLKEHLQADDFLLDFDAFIEESFTNLQINETPPLLETSLIAQSPDNSSVAVAAESKHEFDDLDLFGAPDFASESAENDAWETDDFEIDEEMLEIFALEAEDLLRNINVNLEALAEQPANREALMEIRRNAHTFKGSAGIVGLKKPSDLAHRVEDLLDFMAENDIAGNERIFCLLLASTDCLSALTSGENSAQLDNKIQQLYKNFDEMLAALSAPPVLEVQQIAEAAPPTENIPNFEIVPPADSEPKAASLSGKSIVRVSLERLDDLVKIVRDLVISRSVFEQRLGELDRQIEELHHSTRRLQRSTTKLETDFEADVLNAQSFERKMQNQRSVAEVLTPIAANSHSFDTLEFDRYTDFHQTTRELVETTSDAFAINSALDNLHGNLEMLFDTQRRLIEEMQDKLLRIRMVGFGTLAPRLSRTVRVACEEQNKQADLVIEGDNLEIDTQILDSLIEPLLHLLRNAVAHGIEPPDTRRLLGKPEKGKIFLRAANEGTHVIITISDDGRGISAAGLKEKAVQNNFLARENLARMSEEEVFELIFLPGLTTAEKLSQISGRGVGMNIIKTAVERQQGTISVASEPQKGTTFTLRLPVALAVTRALLVESGEQIFAFPLGLVKQIVEVSGANLEKAQRENVLQTGGSIYAVSHLNELLNFSSPAVSHKETARILLLDVLESPRALLVDRIIKPEEIVIKPLGSPLVNVAGLLGATILGDGKIVPVLDLFYFFKHHQQKTKINGAPLDITALAQNQKPQTISVLIVDDSPSVRHLTSNIIKNAGFQAIIAKDGLEALEVLQTAKELPDVILTDVEMPRMDGYEMLSSLKKNHDLQNIPVVMITSRASEKHRQKAFDLGVSEYLTKPFDDAKLIGIIRALSKQF